MRRKKAHLVYFLYFTKAQPFGVIGSVHSLNKSEKKLFPQGKKMLGIALSPSCSKRDIGL